MSNEWTFEKATKDDLPKIFDMIENEKDDLKYASYDYTIYKHWITNKIETQEENKFYVVKNKANDIICFLETQDKLLNILIVSTPYRRKGVATFALNSIQRRPYYAITVIQNYPANQFLKKCRFYVVSVTHHPHGMARYIWNYDFGSFHKQNITLNRFPESMYWQDYKKFHDSLSDDDKMRIMTDNMFSTFDPTDKNLKLYNISALAKPETIREEVAKSMFVPSCIGISNYIPHRRVNYALIIGLGDEHGFIKDFPDIVTRNTYRTRLFMECPTKVFPEMNLPTDGMNVYDEYVNPTITQLVEDGWRNPFYNCWYRQHLEDIMPLEVSKRVDLTKLRYDQDYIIVDGVMYHIPPLSKSFVPPDTFDMMACDINPQCVSNPLAFPPVAKNVLAWYPNAMEYVKRGSGALKDKVVNFIEWIQGNPQPNSQFVPLCISRPSFEDTIMTPYALNTYEQFNLATLFKYQKDIHYWVEQYFTHIKSPLDPRGNMACFDEEIPSYLTNLYTCNELVKFILDNDKPLEDKVAILNFGVKQMEVITDFYNRILPSRITLNEHFDNSPYVIVFLHDEGGYCAFNDAATRGIIDMCHDKRLSYCVYYRTMFDMKTPPELFSEKPDILDTYDLEYEYSTMLTHIDAVFGDKKLVLYGRGYGGTVAKYFRKLDKENRILRVISVDSMNLKMNYIDTCISYGPIPYDYDKNKFVLKRDGIWYDNNKLNTMPAFDNREEFYRIEYDCDDCDDENVYIVDCVMDDTLQIGQHKLKKVPDCKYYKHFYEIRYNGRDWYASPDNHPDVVKNVFDTFLKVYA